MSHFSADVADSPPAACVRVKRDIPYQGKDLGARIAEPLGGSEPEKGGLAGARGPIMSVWPQSSTWRLNRNGVAPVVAEQGRTIRRHER